MPNRAGYHACLGCPGRDPSKAAKWITWRFAICTDCEEHYGRSAYDWPEWLRYLWRKEQRDRRREKKISEREVSLSTIDGDEVDYD